MKKGVIKNNDGLMIKSYDVMKGFIEFTKDIKDAFPFYGGYDTNMELDYIKHHLSDEHKELETMIYSIESY